MKTLQES